MLDKRLIKSVATGTFCGLLTSVILMCILTVGLLKTGLPQGFFLWGSLVKKSRPMTDGQESPSNPYCRRAKK